jgi:hypothetical protein
MNEMTRLICVSSGLTDSLTGEKGDIQTLDETHTKMTPMHKGVKYTRTHSELATRAIENISCSTKNKAPFRLEVPKASGISLILPGVLKRNNEVVSELKIVYMLSYLIPADPVNFLVLKLQIRIHSVKI